MLFQSAENQKPYSVLKEKIAPALVHDVAIFVCRWRKSCLPGNILTLLFQLSFFYTIHQIKSAAR